MIDSHVRQKILDLYKRLERFLSGSKGKSMTHIPAESSLGPG